MGCWRQKQWNNLKANQGVVILVLNITVYTLTHCCSPCSTSLAFSSSNYQPLMSIVISWILTQYLQNPILIFSEPKLIVDHTTLYHRILNYLFAYIKLLVYSFSSDFLPVMPLTQWGSLVSHFDTDLTDTLGTTFVCLLSHTHSFSQPFIAMSPEGFFWMSV